MGLVVIVDELHKDIDLTKEKCNGCEDLGMFEVCGTCPTELERNAMFTQDLERQMARRDV